MGSPRSEGVRWTLGTPLGLQPALVEQPVDLLGHLDWLAAHVDREVRVRARDAVERLFVVARLELGELQAALAKGEAMEWETAVQSILIER